MRTQWKEATPKIQAWYYMIIITIYGSGSNCKHEAFVAQTYFKLQQFNRHSLHLKNTYFKKYTEYMGVSENRGTPKSSMLIGISIINHPFWGIPTFFGNTHRESQLFRRSIVS